MRDVARVAAVLENIFVLVNLNNEFVIQHQWRFCRTCPKFMHDS